MTCISNIFILLSLMIAMVCPAAGANPPVGPQAGQPAVQTPSGGPIPNNQALTGQQPAGQQQVMTDIHDIKPIEDIGIDPRLLTYLLYALAGMLIMAAIIALIVYLKRRKRGRATPEIIIPPDQAALEKLRMLKSDDLMEGKLFYFELSSILRGYMEGRFGLEALEMTTEELLPHVMKMDLDTSLKQGVRAFIDASDPVKFAGMPPVRETMRTHVQFVEHFVQATTPEEAQSSKVKGKKLKGER